MVFWGCRVGGQDGYVGVDDMEDVLLCERSYRVEVWAILYSTRRHRARRRDKAVGRLKN